jgi:hypothetical protein
VVVIGPPGTPSIEGPDHDKEEREQGVTEETLEEWAGRFPAGKAKGARGRRKGARVG